MDFIDGGKVDNLKYIADNNISVNEVNLCLQQSGWLWDVLSKSFYKLYSLLWIPLCIWLLFGHLFLTSANLVTSILQTHQFICANAVC